MEQIYVREGTRRFPCTVEYMLQHQGSDHDPYTLVVKDEDEADYWNGMRFVTGHKLIVSTCMDEGTEIFDPKVYFTFSEEETVRRGNAWVYRALKS